MKLMNRLLGLLLLLLVTGCAGQKKILYLQDLEEGERLRIEKSYDVKITYDDLLGITVHSRNPELTIPFTLQSGGSSTSTSIGTTGTSGSSGQKGIEYLVDSKGEIDFPILGKLHVVGMTRMELTNYIKQRLIDEDYIKDPIVIVKFLNFKVSVLGDVGTSKTINVNSDRITIFEAISQAGDLGMTGRRKNVMVLREENGTRVPYYLDLRSKEVFDSPCYYLQQNDLVYVEPNKNKMRQGNMTQYKNVTAWSSLLSFAMSIATLILVNK